MQYREFSLFAIINYMFPNFMWTKGIIDGFTMLTLKFIAGVFCAGLVLREHWPDKFDKYFPLYWYFTLTFCLPFTMTIMVIDHNFANGWIVITLLSTFLLSALVSWKDYLIMQFIGIIFAILFFKFITGDNHLNQLDLEIKFWSLYAVLFASCISLIFSRNKESLEKEKEDESKSIAGLIAHEVRNPLFALGGSVYGIKKALSKNDVNKVSSIIDFFDKTLKETNFTIQMILTQLRGIHSDDYAYTSTSINECINEAIDEYFFVGAENYHEKNKIKFSSNEDFMFKGNKVLMKHIIFNLLKNSLSPSLEKQPTYINLEIFKSEGENILTFKDNGSGLKTENLNNLFKSYKSSSDNGTGLGLFFCYKVMKNFNGTITCSSKENEFTIFTLSFKPID